MFRGTSPLGGRIEYHHGLSHLDPVLPQQRALRSRFWGTPGKWVTLSILSHAKNPKAERLKAEQVSPWLHVVLILMQVVISSHVREIWGTQNHMAV